MGVYDTVWVPCPECGEVEDAQSKSGACMLATYTINNCPADVMADVNRHAPFSCRKCGTLFRVKLTILHEVVREADNEHPR